MGKQRREFQNSLTLWLTLLLQEMAFLEQCEAYFGSKDLYAALGLTRDASEKDIKQAYRKMSLKVHPDRVSQMDKDEATQKFQTLGKIYNVLSDGERRKVYDESGCVDDEANNDIFDWKQFWASRFGNFDEVIKEYAGTYWGSEDEKRDLKKAYRECKGDMNKMMKSMYCRVVEHEPRYRKVIESWIKNKEVPNYDAFTKETKARRLARKRKYEKESEIVEKNAKMFESEVGSSISDIAGIIAQRNQDRLKKQDTFLDNLAAKYVKPKGTKKKPGIRKKKV